MKKVRIALNEGCNEHKFYLFPSQEALYVWCETVEKGEKAPVIDGIDEVTLQQNSFIEVELYAFEYVYNGKSNLDHKRLNYVRVGKSSKPRNAAGTEVSIHDGWVMSSMVPLNAYNDAHINVTVLQPGDDRIDIASLFDADADIDK
jgi:hypothetical protein